MSIMVSIDARIPEFEVLQGEARQAQTIMEMTHALPATP